MNDTAPMSDEENWANGKDSEWQTRLDRIREAVVGWGARLLDPPEVVAGSPLAGDDKIYPPMPCSQLAWWAITVAVEHLDATISALDQQVAAGGPILPSANFTVLRGALVGASEAVVLLGPDSRTERTTAGLQMAHEEYRQVLNFRKTVLDSPGLIEEVRAAAMERDWLVHPRKRLAEIGALLKERNVSPKEKLTDTEIIKRAASLVHADAALLQLMLQMGWALGSGAAHGRLLMALHRPDGHQIEGGAHALFGGTFDQVAQEIASVTLVLNEAWRLWELRNTPLF